MYIPLSNGTVVAQTTVRGSLTDGNSGSHGGRFSDRYKMDFSDDDVEWRRGSIVIKKKVRGQMRETAALTFDSLSF